MSRVLPRIPLTGLAGVLTTIACSLPILVGFGIPLWIFAGYALRRLDQLTNPNLYSALLNSVFVAGLAAFLAVLLALVIANSLRNNRNPRMQLASRLAVVGYALPGTILGTGLLLMLAGADNVIADLYASFTGERLGLVFTGTAFAIVYACTIRFLAVADASIQSGINKLPTDIDPAARMLGRSARQTAYEILIPLLRPAIAAAAVIVFVDTIKELSATILLRPFDFNTLSTLVYENASRGAVEDGALAALFIVGAAVIPVVMLSRSLANDQGL